MNLKAERIKILEKCQRDASPSKRLGDNMKHQKNKPSYEQPTFVVTEEEMQRKGGKDAILKKLRKTNTVAFPEKSTESIPDANKTVISPKSHYNTMVGMSRIEQLKSNSNAFTQSQKKKVMFS